MTMMTRKGKAMLKSSQISMVLMAAVGGRLDDMNEGERSYGFRNKFRENILNKERTRGKYNLAEMER